MTDEMVQRGDLDLETFLPQRISMLSRLTQNILARALGENGLTIAHWRIFHCLVRLGPADLNTIVNFTILPQSTLSRAVAKLDDMGYVASERRADNRRHLRISLTAAGRVCLSDAIANVERHWHAVFPLTPAQERDFTADINRIIDALVEQHADGRT